MLEEAQAQAEHAALSTRNNYLVTIANRTMLGSNDYPNKTKRWNKLDTASYKWDLWKPTCQEVYIANRRKSEIQGEQGKPFDGIVSTAETSNAAKKAVNFFTADHVTETKKNGGFPWQILGQPCRCSDELKLHLRALLGKFHKSGQQHRHTHRY